MVTEQNIEKFSVQCKDIFKQIERDVVGQKEVVEATVIAMIAGGNVLLEGVPGVGKTRLVRTLGRVFSMPFSRIQFTPDLMPADVTGTNIIVKDEDGNSKFEFQPGPIFSNIILADEINRATPKTQSALLEAMQEHTVTVMGVSRKMNEPFFVLATQNPIEQDGTYPLPEAQMDRFMFKIIVIFMMRLATTSILSSSVRSRYPPSSRSIRMYLGRLFLNITDLPSLSVCRATAEKFWFAAVIVTILSVSIYIGNILSMCLGGYYRIFLSYLSIHPILSPSCRT